LAQLSERILSEVTAFFVASHDFNGILVSVLQERLAVTDDEVIPVIRSLLQRGLIVPAFYSHQDNPHILRLEPPPLSEQLRLLGKEEAGTVALYPVREALLARPDLSLFDDQPFARRLALGEPQLTALFFELRVLDQYYRDPRYKFDFREYSGKLTIRDDAYRSSDTPDRDKVFLQSFGIAYDQKRRRVVAAFLRYLKDLTAEHQAIWAAHQVEGPCVMNSDYRDATLFGRWPRYRSAYAALLAEMREICKLSGLIGKPPLFRETWEQERPPGFHPMLRPTTRSLEDFVHVLDKIISENIDREFFKGDLPLEDSQERPDGRIVITTPGTLTLLERWLSTFYRTADGQNIAAEVLTPLKAIRTLRQRPAHRLTEDAYDEELSGQQDALVGNLVRGLTKLRLILSSHPLARSLYSAPEWLDGDKIVFY
jgi:hypothetical protein